jgi:hypothetical protein
MIVKTGRPEIPTSVTPDARMLFYTTPGETGMGADVWVHVGDGPAGRELPFLSRPGDQSQAQLSPDRHWVAYVSNDAGPNEVFVAELRVDPAGTSASAGDSIRISEGGGSAPRWRRDSRELFYLTRDGSVMSIQIDAARQFHPNTARRLFTARGVVPEWGVTEDGSRFLFAVPVSEPPPFTIIQDWQAPLKDQR